MILTKKFTGIVDISEMFLSETYYHTFIMPFAFLFPYLAKKHYFSNMW